MAEDTKMKGENPKTEEGKKEEKVEPPPMPALEAAARRLERLLGGGLSEKDRHLHTYANPAKVVRRWLGTASGASGNATFADIASAATTLLDPAGPCSNGLQILIADNDGAMDVDSSESKKLGFLTIASSREVESWLISLSVRLLWKEKKLTEAFDLVQKGIAILLEHLNVASTNLTSLSGVSTSSVFPTLARMYRYRSLVVEAMKNDGITASLRQDMVKAHNLACLRRDVDSQATLLNLMLRDLLLHSQSKLVSSSPIQQCLASHTHTFPSHLDFSRASTQVALELDIPRVCFKQSALSLLVPQRLYSVIAFGIHQGLFEPQSKFAKVPYQHWPWLPYCRTAFVGGGTTVDGRNSGTTCLLYQGHADRVESLLGYYPSGPKGRFGKFHQGRVGTGLSPSAGRDLHTHFAFGASGCQGRAEETAC
jgi:hypothetical protein